MRAFVRVPVLLVIASLALAACGGGGGGGASPSAGASAAASEAAPSSAPSEGAPSTEPSAEPSTGGGTAVGVCELVTADELAGIFGTTVTTTVLAGPPDNCIVSSTAGDPLAAWSLSTAQAQAVYDALTSDPATVVVPGIGDKAAIVQNTGLLVLKGSNLLVITISGGADMSEEEGIEASKQIGTFAAGRL
ncbi:MAG TPA: hypothetical protein VFC71_06115 [Candidatus Polarisedimenticolia bacterium]|nr:hypothetical protein [Candidatus Polarisedimenticolia bacterium]